jgi:hypothetical protein
MTLQGVTGQPDRIIEVRGSKILLTSSDGLGRRDEYLRAISRRLGWPACDRLRRMLATRLVVILAASAVLAAGAELRGTWSATTPRGNLAGTWTAEDHQSGVTGTWTVQEAAGKILMQGGWSASKSAQSWEGAWRSTISGSNGEYSGTWTSTVSTSPKAPLIEMFESALRAVVTGTWKAGSSSGSWSIRTLP